jgi:hypothetical protein
VIGSRYHADWHVCDLKLTFEGRAVRVCQPYAVADLIPIFILIGLSLLPDLSELELPGGWKLKVRLDRQEHQTAELQREVERIEQTLTVTTSQQQNLHVGFVAADRALARSEAAVKAGDGHPGQRAEATSEPRDSEQRGDVGPRDDRLATSRQLQNLWSVLEAWTHVGADDAQSADLREWLTTPSTERSGLALSRRDTLLANRIADWIATRGLGNEPLSSDQLAEVQQWVSELMGPLDYVRRERNSVVYGPDLMTVDDINTVVGIGDRLLTNLEQRLWKNEASDPGAD